MNPTRLRSHQVILTDGDLTLRPLTELDWGLVMHFNDDPEIGRLVEGDVWEPPVLDEQQAIYRRISQVAYCFVIEFAGRPIGEGWLQLMNLSRLIGRWPDLDLRRIDLIIRDRDLWGQGIGRRAIALLTSFGFEAEGADAIFGCDMWDFNARSLGAFRRSGYEEELRLPAPLGVKGSATIDIVRWREPKPGAGASADFPPLAPPDIADLLQRVRGALSMPAWVTGGVGVDLLTGRWTRDHDDVDLGIDRRHREQAFAELDRAGFHVTTDLGWHSRWTRLGRAIGELEVDFTRVKADGSATWIIGPDEGIGAPGRYPGIAGEVDPGRIGAVGDITFQVASAESQWALRQRYLRGFPDASVKAKVTHDLELLEPLILLATRQGLDGLPLEPEPLQPEDSEDAWMRPLLAGRTGIVTDPDRARRQLTVVGELTRLLEGEGIRCWLSGGWAVDFHLGDITRDHDDVDVLVFADDVEGALACLETAGFNGLPVSRPEEHRHLRRDGERVSLTLIDRDDHGNLVTPGRWADWPYAADVLDGPRLKLGGVTCAVMSISALISEKQGFAAHPAGAPLRPHDRADLLRLRLLVGDPSA